MDAGSCVFKQSVKLPSSKEVVKKCKVESKSENIDEATLGHLRFIWDWGWTDIT